MTYNAVESSTSNASVIELYQFTIGTESHRFTSTEHAISNSMGVFKPSNIKRSRIKQTQNMHKDGITLTVPVGFELSKVLLNPLMDDAINVSVFRGHTTDPDNQFVAYWLGRIVGCTAGDASIEISCESVFTSIKRPGLRAVFEINCRRAIYSTECGVSLSEFLAPATVTAINGSTIEFTPVNPVPSGYFIGGILKLFDGTTRFIANHVGDTLTLFQPVNGLLPTHTIHLFPGCNRSMDHCKNRFNNLDNFGGFPYIPIVNPFSPISTW